MEKYQNLFNHLAEHFNIHPTVTEMEDIIQQVESIKSNTPAEKEEKQSKWTLAGLAKVCVKK